MAGVTDIHQGCSASGYSHYWIYRLVLCHRFIILEDTYFCGVFYHEDSLLIAAVSIHGSCICSRGLMHG